MSSRTLNIFISDSFLAKDGFSEVAKSLVRCRLPILPNPRPGAKEIATMAMAVITSKIPPDFALFISSTLFTLLSC